MSTDSPSTPQIPIPKKLKNNWGWFLALGIGLVFFGAVGLGMPLIFTGIVMTFVGVGSIIGGVSMIVHSFSVWGWGGFFLEIMLGGLYFLAGLLMLVHPLEVASIFTLFIGISILISGILRVILSTQTRKVGNWIWILLSGVIGIILGFLIILWWQNVGYVFIGILVAIEMILHGWTWIMVSLAARTIRIEKPQSS